MKRSDFIKTLGLGASGLILPKNLLNRNSIKIYDNFVRGLPHYGYKKVKNNIKEGDNLILKRDIDNIYDSFAIEVFYEDIKLGYIAAYENIVLANMLDSKVELEAKISKNNKNKKEYERLGIEIFADLISPTTNLITELKNQRADEVIDIYRKGYGLE